MDAAKRVLFPYRDFCCERCKIEFVRRSKETPKLCFRCERKVNKFIEHANDDLPEEG